MKNSIIYPARGQWITPRTTTGENLTEENCVILCDKPIQELKDVYFDTRNISVMYTYRDEYGLAPSPDTRPLNSLSLDGEPIIALNITEYVVEYAKYITLKLYAKSAPTYEVCKNNALYYRRYENKIYIPNSAVGTIWDRKYIFQNLIETAVLTLSLKGVLTAPNNATVISISGLTDSANFDPRQYGFRVTYTPLGETTKLDIPKAEPQPISFSIPYNQQQQIISNVGQGRQTQILANMMGVQKREVVRILRTPMQRRPLYTTYREGSDVWVLIAMPEGDEVKKEQQKRWA